MISGPGELTYDRGPMSGRMPEILTVRTRALEIGYEAHGVAGGIPVVLLHGFPDDARACAAKRYDATIKRPRARPVKP